MFKNIYSTGVVLGLFIVLVYFLAHTFMQDVDFFRNSMLINAFVLPVLFAGTALGSIITYKKYKGSITFREAFGRAFIPMFVGAALSLVLIFSYINFINPETKVLLNHQYIESYRAGLEDEYQKAKKIVKPNSKEAEELEVKYAQGKERIAAKVEKNEDMFTFRYFSFVLAGYSVFFLLLSLFLGSFFRTRSVL